MSLDGHRLKGEAARLGQLHAAPSTGCLSVGGREEGLSAFYFPLTFEMLLRCLSPVWYSSLQCQVSLAKMC